MKKTKEEMKVCMDCLFVDKNKTCTEKRCLVNLSIARGNINNYVK